MLIALAGLPRVGKDYFANHLINIVGSDCIVKYSFAQPIKEVCSILFGWSLESFEMDDKELIDPTLGVSRRSMMEYIGTAIMRKDICKHFPLFNKIVGENIWVHRAEDFLEKNKDKDIIITDTRHLIEYNMLKAKGAIFVKIDRPNYPLLDTSKCYDISLMPKFDHVIVNAFEGQIEKYQKKVVELYNNLHV